MPLGFTVPALPRCAGPFFLLASTVGFSESHGRQKSLIYMQNIRPACGHAQVLKVGTENYAVVRPKKARNTVAITLLLYNPRCVYLWFFKHLADLTFTNIDSP